MTFHDFNLGQLKKCKFLRKDLWIGHVKKQNAKHKRWTHTNNNLVLWPEPKSVLTWFCWTCVLRRLIDTDEAWLGRGKNTTCNMGKILAKSRWCTYLSCFLLCYEECSDNRLKLKHSRERQYVHSELISLEYKQHWLLCGEQILSALVSFAS